MAKCPNCGGTLIASEGGVLSCENCKKKFRKRSAAPAAAPAPASAPGGEIPKAPVQAAEGDPVVKPESQPVIKTPEAAPQPVRADAESIAAETATPAPAATPKAGSAAEQEELAMLRARIAAMEAKQAELERASVLKKREGGAGAAVISFAKKWGLKAVLPAVLALIALITLLVCFCGMRGIYVNVDNPNEFYSFDATSYEYHGTLLGEDYVEKGSWKVDGGQLKLTYKDEDFGKLTESYDYSSIGSNKTIFITDDFGVKKEFKRVSLLAYSTPQKIKITFDDNGGAYRVEGSLVSYGSETQRIAIGSKLEERAEPIRNGYRFMGWYTTPDGWKTGEGEQLFFEDRVWEKATYYANWKNTSTFTLTGYGLEEPIQFTEGDDIRAAYMRAMGWDSLPEGVTELIFKDSAGNEIDPAIAPAASIRVAIVGRIIENGVLKYVSPELNEFVIPDSVTSIGGSAFRDCTSLTSITIPNGVTSIRGYAFDGCKAEIVWGDTPAIAEIGDRAFSGYAGTSITIPDSVTSIGEWAFSDCAAEIIWGGTPTITEIGGYAFAGYDGTSITIPDSVTSIGSHAFYYCTALESITIPFVGATKEGTSNTHFGYIFGASSYHYNDDYVPTSLKEVIITGGTIIGSYVFADCTSLTSVTIPDSVMSIGSSAFSGCSSLESMTIPFVGATKDGTSNTHFGYIFGASSYSDNGNYVPASLKEVIITGGTSIGAIAFSNCTSLTSVVIPGGVTSICEGAFAGCLSLSSVIIPGSVTSIEGGAFLVCKALTSVTFEGTMAQWNAVTKGTEMSSVGLSLEWNFACPFTEVKCSDGTVPV